jgi:hypothetical protein
VMLKRRIYTLKQRPLLPPIVTHNMVFNDTDGIFLHYILIAINSPNNSNICMFNAITLIFDFHINPLPFEEKESFQLEQR